MTTLKKLQLVKEIDYTKGYLEDYPYFKERQSSLQ